MRVALLLVAVLALSCKVWSFKCWLCRKGPAASMSFDACDKNREEQTCNPGLDACGIFSYENKTGHRLYGKSCTYRTWCGKEDLFCKNVKEGGRYCRVQCCYDELCNYWTQYQATDSPLPTVNPATNPSDEYWCDWSSGADTVAWMSGSSIITCLMNVFVGYLITLSG